MAQSIQPTGSLPNLSYKNDTRIWLSSSGYGYTDAHLFNCVPALVYNGGLDGMYAHGEPNQISFTWGSQRPAFYQNIRYHNTGYDTVRCKEER